MLKFVFIFKLYLYDVWHTSKDDIYIIQRWYLYIPFERKYLIGSYCLLNMKPGWCLYIPHFCTENSNKTSIHSDFIAQSLLTKTLLNMFMPSIFTTTNPCVSIHFLLSDRLTIALLKFLHWLCLIPRPL